MNWQTAVVFANNNEFKLEVCDSIAQCFQTRLLIKHIWFNFYVENPANVLSIFHSKCQAKSCYCSLEAWHGTFLLSSTSGHNAVSVFCALISEHVDSYMGGIRFPQRRIFWNVINRNKTPRRSLVWSKRLLLIGPRPRLLVPPLQCLNLRCGLIWRAGVITAC